MINKKVKTMLQENNSINIQPFLVKASHLKSTKQVKEETKPRNTFNQVINYYLKTYQVEGQFLSLTQEQELITKFKSSGEGKYAEQLFANYILYTAKIIRRNMKFIKNTSENELLSICYISFLKCLENFDVTKNFRLSTLLFYYYRENLNKYSILTGDNNLQLSSSASTKYFNLANKIKSRLNLEENKVGTLNYNQKVDLVTKEFEISEQEFFNLEKYTQRVSSIDDNLTEKAGDAEFTLKDVLKDDTDIEEEIIEQNDLSKKRQILYQVIKEFPNKRNAEIYVMRFIEGKTLDVIGSKYGLTKERIRQISEKVAVKIKARANELLKTCGT